MNRRRFLAYLGIGTLGGLAGREVVQSQGSSDSPRRRDAPEDWIETPTSSGLQRVIWSVDTDEPAAAVTFDDGPDPEFTPRILDVLDRHQVRATFMVMGYNAVRHPYLLQEIVEAGHEIGSHGWSHLNLAHATVKQTRREIEFGTRMIEERAGVPIRIFRPPYGRFGESAVRLLANSRRDLVIWSITRGKLTLREPKQVADHVIGSLGPGEIVDLHDGIGRATFNPTGKSAARIRRRREIELEALPSILEGARERGLGFETVSDLTTAWQPRDASG